MYAIANKNIQEFSGKRYDPSRMNFIMCPRFLLNQQLWESSLLDEMSWSPKGDKTNHYGVYLLYFTLTFWLCCTEF